MFHFYFRIINFNTQRNIPDENPLLFGYKQTRLKGVSK